MGKYKEKKESYIKKTKVLTKVAFEDYNGENMVHQARMFQDDMENYIFKANFNDADFKYFDEI